MERPSNLREALLADALGDLQDLLNRVDKLVPAIRDARKSIDEARIATVATMRDMTVEGQAVKKQVLAAAEGTRIAAQQYLAEHTKQLVVELTVRQSKAITDTTKSLLETEVRPTLRALTIQLAEQANRARDPWRDLQAHAITGVLAALATTAALLLAAYLLGLRCPDVVAEPPVQTIQAPGPAPTSSAASPSFALRTKSSHLGGSELR